MAIKRCLSLVASIVGIFFMVVSGTAAERTESQPYFEGKKVTVIVSWDPGGRIDRQARTVSKFLSKYVPGRPDFIIQNIPGGSGIPANRRFSRSKPDGTTIMMETSRDLESAAFSLPGANYDPLKYVWIGAVSTGKQRNVLITHKRAGFQTLDDLKGREVVLGAPRVGHRAYLYGRLIGKILGLKTRWVVGYRSPEMDLAIQRGEVDGRVNDAATIMTRRPDWVEKRLIVPHVAMTLPQKLPPLGHPLFAHVPSLMKFATAEVHRDMIRKINTTGLLSGSLALPAGTPERIRRILEKALLKTGEDRKFQRSWEKFVLRGTSFAGVFPGKNVVEAVRLYLVWDPDVLKAYKRLGFQAP